MSDGMFIYDPEKVPALIDRWMEDVGALHLGHKYTGYMFFNDDRELLDVYLPDIDGEWVDVGYDIQSSELRGWGGVVEKAQGVGATDIIVIHAHLYDEPEGPCPELELFVETGIKVFAKFNMNLRGVAVLRGDSLDGMVFVSSSVPAPMSDFDEMISGLQDMASKGDARAVKLIPILEQIQAGLDRGERPDPALLEQAIEITMAALHDIEQKQINPLSLPIFGVNGKELLN